MEHGHKVLVNHSQYPTINTEILNCDADFIDLSTLASCENFICIVPGTMGKRTEDPYHGIHTSWKPLQVQPRKAGRVSGSTSRGGLELQMEQSWGRGVVPWPVHKSLYGSFTCLRKSER